MQNEQLYFLTTGMFEKLKGLEPSSPAKWGVMNAQEMTEHMADFFDISSAKFPMKLYTPEEHLPKYKEFLMSDKEFRENTKAPADLLGEKPKPVRLSSLDEAIGDLQRSVDDFTAYFKNDPGRLTTHPVFGPLNFDEWTRLHYKHAVHHLKQFSLL